MASATAPPTPPTTSFTLDGQLANLAFLVPDTWPEFDATADPTLGCPSCNTQLAFRLQWLDKGQPATVLILPPSAQGALETACVSTNVTNKIRARIRKKAREHTRQEEEAQATIRREAARAREAAAAVVSTPANREDAREQEEDTNSGEDEEDIIPSRFSIAVSGRDFDVAGLVRRL